MRHFFFFFFFFFGLCFFASSFLSSFFRALMIRLSWLVTDALSFSLNLFHTEPDGFVVAVAAVGGDGAVTWR